MIVGHARSVPVRSKLTHLADALYRNIPCGVGSQGLIKLSKKEEKKVLAQGSKWALNQGMGIDSDIEHTEDYGCLDYRAYRSLRLCRPRIH